MRNRPLTTIIMASASVLLFATFTIPCWAQVSLSLAEPPQGGVGLKGAAPSQPVVTYNGIQYNGGPVMNQVNGVNVYLIWYGNWSNNTEPDIVTDFVKNIGGTAYFNINTSYYDFNKFGGGVKDPVVNRVNFAGSVYDNYSLGTNLTDDNVAAVVGRHIGGPENFPVDPNGVYFVLTSKDVMEATFGTRFCGWHSYGIEPNNGNSGAGTPIKVAFIGDPDEFPAFCLVQNPSPNNNPAADTTVSYIAHELSETVTDPLLNAWTNPGIIEMGDLCENSFGTTYLLPNGSRYNLRFGTRLYLVQQLWVNARGGYCALALDE